MKFSDCEMRPGEILEVVDNYGTIKASCTGLFSDQDDVEKLPPIYQAPFIKSSRFYYAAPHEGDLIWVIFNWDNPQELFYCFRDDMNDNSSDLDLGPKDIEIYAKRTDPNDRNKVVFSNTYDSDNGYHIVNDGSEIFMDNSQNHDIGLKHSSGIGLFVEENKINLGTKGGATYKAVCGEPLINALKAIRNVFQQIANVSTNQYTAPIKGAITNCMSQLDDAITDSRILSNKVTLDK